MSGAPDLAPGMETLFAGVPEEGHAPAALIRGELPDWLRGSCYWNGPGRFERAGLRYRHWLDGDGFVSALHFGNGHCESVRRFVRSAKWNAEEAAGRPLYRTFGTRFAGDALARGIGLESPVNVSVIPYGGALLACGEQGLPWQLDPLTLATRGPYSFAGALNPISPFAAHAKVDLATGDLYNFGLSYAREQPAVHFYCFDAEGRLRHRRRMALPAPMSIHDFCLGPRHLILHLGAYLLDLEAVVRDGRSIFEALHWEAERGSELLLLPRDPAAGTEGVRVPLGGGYCLHGIGAGEDARGRLVIDLVELDQPIYDQYQIVPDLFTAVGPGRPVRLVVDPIRGELLERHPLGYEQAPDFPVRVPRADGRAEPDVWMLGIGAMGGAGRKFFDQLVHGHWGVAGGDTVEVWSSPAGQYLGGEPALALRPDGEAGALVCLLADAGRGESRCLLFDPFAVAAGPFAELRLPHRVPPAFHAAYVPAV